MPACGYHFLFRQGGVRFPQEIDLLPVEHVDLEAGGPGAQAQRGAGEERREGHFPRERRDTCELRARRAAITTPRCASPDANSSSHRCPSSPPARSRHRIAWSYQRAASAYAVIRVVSSPARHANPWPGPHPPRPRARGGSRTRPRRHHDRVPRAVASAPTRPHRADESVPAREGIRRSSRGPVVGEPALAGLGEAHDARSFGAIEDIPDVRQRYVGRIRQHVHRVLVHQPGNREQRPTRRRERRRSLRDHRLHRERNRGVQSVITLAQRLREPRPPGAGSRLYGVRPRRRGRHRHRFLRLTAAARRPAHRSEDPGRRDACAGPAVLGGRVPTATRTRRRAPWPERRHRSTGRSVPCPRAAPRRTDRHRGDRPGRAGASPGGGRREDLRHVVEQLPTLHTGSCFSAERERSRTDGTGGGQVRRATREAAHARVARRQRSDHLWPRVQRPFAGPPAPVPDHPVADRPGAGLLRGRVLPMPAGPVMRRTKPPRDQWRSSSRHLDFHQGCAPAHERRSPDAPLGHAPFHHGPTATTRHTAGEDRRERFRGPASGVCYSWVRSDQGSRGSTVIEIAAVTLGRRPRSRPSGTRTSGAGSEGTGGAERRELWLSEVNLSGDGQADLSVHGGVDKAVYVYLVRASAGVARRARREPRAGRLRREREQHRCARGCRVHRRRLVLGRRDAPGDPTPAGRATSSPSTGIGPTSRRCSGAPAAPAGTSGCCNPACTRLAFEHSPLDHFSR